MAEKSQLEGEVRELTQYRSIGSEQIRGKNRFQAEILSGGADAHVTLASPFAARDFAKAWWKVLSYFV